MTPTTNTPAPDKRRGRPRKVEPYADWMARIDASVDTMARKMERKPPTYAYLHPAQRRIVRMLIEHLRSLPELAQGGNCYDKPEYLTVNRILKEMFLAKYPAWAQAPKGGGCWDVDKLRAARAKCTGTWSSKHDYKVTDVACKVLYYMELNIAKEGNE